MAYSHSNPAHGANDTDGPAHAGGAVGYLLSGNEEQRRESRLVLLGIAAFLLLAMTAFNLAFYGKARQRLELEGWARLEAAADLRADQLDHLLGTLIREASSVERDPVVEDRANRRAVE